MSSNLATPAGRTYWQNPRAACVTVFVLVFLVGAAAGALAMTLGHKSLHKSPFWNSDAKSAYLEKVKKDLDLTPTQTREMESILDDFAQYYRTVLSDGRSRIYQILNEEQKKKFAKMLEQDRVRQP